MKLPATKRVYVNPRRIVQEYGGAAMEYIIVSTFAAVLSIAAITVTAQIFKDRLAKISDQLGIDLPDIELGLFDE